MLQLGSIRHSRRVRQKVASSRVSEARRFGDSYRVTHLDLCQKTYTKSNLRRIIKFSPWLVNREQLSSRGRHHEGGGFSGPLRDQTWAHIDRFAT